MYSNLIKSLINTAAYAGNNKKYNHSSLNTYLLGYRKNIAVIDLDKSLTSLLRSSILIKEAVQNNQSICYTSSTGAHSALLNKIADHSYQYALIWSPGILTNWQNIKDIINQLTNKKTEDFSFKISSKIRRSLKKILPLSTTSEPVLGRRSAGSKTASILNELSKRSLQLFIAVNPSMNNLKELSYSNMPAITLIDSNFQGLNLTDYPIVCNTQSIETITFYSSVFSNLARKNLLYKLKH